MVAPEHQRLTQCPDCGGKVSLSALACPHCGRPSESQAQLAEATAKKCKQIQLHGTRIGVFAAVGFVVCLFARWGPGAMSFFFLFWIGATVYLIGRVLAWWYDG